MSRSTVDGGMALAAKRAEVAANPSNMRHRLDLLRMLTAAGQLEEATEAHVWWWQHALEHDRELLGVRSSFFLDDLAKLSAQYPPARAAIVRLRDAVVPPRDHAPEPAALSDWACLNHVLGSTAETLRWFDEVYRMLPDPGRLALFVELYVVPLLLAEARWADAGALLSQPLARLAQARVYTEDTLDTILDAAVRERSAERLRDTAAMLVRALSAAGRSDDALAVATEARRLDPSGDMAAALADEGV